ncbi:MAG: undecaprenyl-diphosphate phosphatase [Thermodesulfobacteriota bacterium]
MTPFDAIFLGLLQGVTEFLPVSSSGHLVIAQHLMKGFKQPGVLFDVMLHVGTLGAVLIYFRRDIYSIAGSFFHKASSRDKKSRRLALLIIIGTFPTALIALSFKDIFEQLFTSVSIAGVMLIITGCLLFATEWIKDPARKEGDLTIIDAVIIGIAQGIAIIPGISRSGSTIATGIFRKIDSVVAARFSFLLSIPAVLGAIFLEAKKFNQLATQDIGVYILGMLTAGLSGLLAITFLMKIIAKGRLKFFSYYCFALGGIVLLFLA